MDSLTRAFAQAERSYLNAKQAASQTAESLLATSPGAGSLVQRSDLSRASEQLRHFSGWVYAAIRPIAQRIAGQAIKVGRAKAPSRVKQSPQWEALESHPILDLLNDPNDLMVAWSLMYVTVASLELTGRCLWWLPKKKQILPIPTSWLVGFQGSTKITAFTIRPPKQAEAINLPADECVYFAYPDPSDPHGALSPLQAAAHAVDADEAISDSQIAMFRRGIHPSHAIVVGRRPHPDVPGGIRPRLTDAQQRQIINAIRKRYAGVAQHGEPLILDGLIEDVKRLSNTPAEMDWIGSGKYTKARIMQIFGVNPIIAGEIEGANRASATVADRHFVETTINPKIELLSQTLTEWLAPMFAQPGERLRVWIEPCKPADAEMSLKWAQLLVQAGVVSAHELRRLSPFDLPDDDAFDGRLVGGRNLSTSNLIAQGLQNMVADAMAAFEGDRILEAVSGGRNGNGRI